jgi:hypothetical protein
MIMIIRSLFDVVPKTDLKIVSVNQGIMNHSAEPKMPNWTSGADTPNIFKAEAGTRSNRGASRKKNHIKTRLEVLERELTIAINASTARQR